MPNADDTKPIDLDAIERLLADCDDATALTTALLGSMPMEPVDSLVTACRALLTEVRRLANIVARRARGKRPKLPDDGFDVVLDESIEACRIVGIDILADYDYLGTLRRLVRERNAAQADLERVTTERDEVFGESLVACAILGADPTAPGYDYLEALRAVVKERNELRALQAEQQRAFAEGLRVADKAARTEGARAMRDVVVDRLLADPAMLSLANEIGAFDPAAVAEPES